MSLSSDCRSTMNYKLETAAERLSAVDDAGHEICGAFLQRSLWRLFVTETAAASAAFPFVPHHAHVLSREDAVWWVELYAHWYCLANSQAA